MGKKHTYDIADYVQKDIWRGWQVSKPRACFRLPKLSVFGYAFFLCLLLASPVSHIKAGNFSALSDYQRFTLVETSARYIQTLAPKFSAIELENIRQAILSAAKVHVPQKTQNIADAPYVLISRTPEKEEMSDPAFFRDAAFLGDSITEGLLINGPEESTILASKGMTLKQAAKEIPQLVGASPKKVYILLGINDIADYHAPLDRHITAYRTLLETLMQDLPNSAIYVQSVFPIAEKYNNTKTKLTNEKISQFNTMLSLLCQELGLRYIDISASFLDDSGCMLSTLSSDGLHLRAAYYPFWLNLLMENSN